MSIRTAKDSKNVKEGKWIIPKSRLELLLTLWKEPQNEGLDEETWTWYHVMSGWKPDGKRCKVDNVKPGHKFGEYHDIDIVALLATQCIEIMTGRYLSDIIQIAIEKELTIATAIPTVEAHK